MENLEGPFEYKNFEHKYNLFFEDKSLLKQAFTHSSYVNEHHRHPSEDNERLEFLGDAVLELTVSRYLYKTYTNMAEGELTKLRAAVVCEPALVDLSVELGFNRFILLGKGEEATGGRERPALLADVFEAFIGALYLDQGLDEVDSFLQEHVFPKIRQGAFSHMMDFKSQLQEYVQRQNLGEIAYKVVKEKGPAHDREFVMEVNVDEERMGGGSGRSKKDAEQEAAHQALQYLEHH